MFRQKKTRYNAFDKEKCNCYQFKIKRTVMMGGAGMQFRPCIDIHNGKVKQIVGSSLKDHGDVATENFVAEHDADYFAQRIHNCLDKSTRFITSKGVKTFEDFQDGDEIVVLTKDGDWKKATVHCYGEQDWLYSLF